MKILKILKKMKNEIYKKFIEGFDKGFFIKVGDNRNLNLYIGMDEDSKYAFEFRGKFSPMRIHGSDVISVSQTKDNETLMLRFSLENVELLEYFCTFCQDLVESTNHITDDNTAYRMLYSRFMSWKKLFKPNKGNLTELEIMGLIGELLFLKEYMIPKYGVDNSLDSWMGPEKTHKDFSTDDVWYEIKTLNAGKESVRISSLEQLDSDKNGYLVIYALERMSPSYDGIKLNKLVDEILGGIKIHIQRELFMSKLELYGFDFSSEYNNYVYTLIDNSSYLVNDEFPKLVRKTIPSCINKIQYEIILSEIEKYKTNI